MKTGNELKAIVRDWWEWNKPQAQVPEAKYFIEQVPDWESGFTEFQKEGYVQKQIDFDIVRCKDVKGGISIRLESGPNVIDGILNLNSGLLYLKDLGEVNTTGSLVFKGASIDG